MVSLPDGYELLDQYRIESTLGQGGFGITYKAYDKPFDRHVALKEFFPSQFATRREDLSIAPRTLADTEMFDFYRTTFRSEGQALAKFNHPNIVHVHQVLDALGTTYLALEHVDGIELETWLRSYNGRPSQRQVDEFLVPLLSALDAIHAAQYLHRDISPRNIMLTRAGLAPKLLDFGAARSITSTSTTAVGLVSNLYSAPEMYSDNPSTQGPWTDIYSVAATVYFAVTGSPPPQAPSGMLQDTYVSAAKRVERVDFRANFLRAIDWGLTMRPRGAAAVDPGLAEAPAALPGPAEPPGAARPGCAQDLHLLPQSRHRAGGRPHLRPARLQVRGRQHLLRHQRDPGRVRLQGAHKRGHGGKRGSGRRHRTGLAHQARPLEPLQAGCAGGPRPHRDRVGARGGRLPSSPSWSAARRCRTPGRCRKPSAR